MVANREQAWYHKTKQCGKWRENKSNKPDLTSKAKIRLNIRNILRIAVISV